MLMGVKVMGHRSEMTFSFSSLLGRDEGSLVIGKSSIIELSTQGGFQRGEVLFHQGNIGVVGVVIGFEGLEGDGLNVGFLFDFVDGAFSRRGRFSIAM